MSGSLAPRRVPVAKPLLGEEEASAARRAILSGWVTQGPEVEAFEREFGALVGAPYACAVSSCTTALHMALLGVGVKPRDEVITASHSFIATANAVRYCGAIPVFVDIQPGTLNMDPALVERAISPRTRAILCVHQVGMPCDIEAIVAIARRSGLKVVEDAACAIGSEVRAGDGWERIGAPRGDVACFSFHPRKLVTTGDGGMLTTRDRELDRAFRLLRQHAMDVPDTARHGADKVIFEGYSRLGYNYRMTDIQAAVGREQLKRLPDIVERRRALAARYRDLLAAIPGLGFQQEPAFARSNWQSFCVRLPDGVEQLAAMQSMLDRGVSTRRGIMCAHREPAYSGPEGEPWSCGSGEGRCACGAGGCARLRESEAAQDRWVILPLYHQMTAAEQDQVVAALFEACRA